MKTINKIYRSATSLLIALSLITVTLTGLNRSAVCSIKSKATLTNCCQKTSIDTGGLAISKSNSCHCPSMSAAVHASFDEITPQTSNILIKKVETVQLLSFESDIDALPINPRHSPNIPSPPDHDRVILLQSFLI